MTPEYHLTTVPKDIVQPARDSAERASSMPTAHDLLGLEAPLQPDRPMDECGVAAVLNASSRYGGAARMILQMLEELQHRGRQGAGMALRKEGPAVLGTQQSTLHTHHRDEHETRLLLRTDDTRFSIWKGRGPVSEVFEGFNEKLRTERTGIGHVRYGTSGVDSLREIHPFAEPIPQFGVVSIAHNGNIENADHLRAALELDGEKFESTADTEVLLKLMKHEPGSLVERLQRMSKKLTGSYSCVVLAEERVYAMRSPEGNRPLVVCDIDGAVVVASETSAVNQYKEKSNLRTVQPGELLEAYREGTQTRINSFRLPTETSPALCALEYIYLSRPSSHLDIGRGSVAQARTYMGAILAREQKVFIAKILETGPAIVVPVLESGKYGAIGFAREAQIPYVAALERNTAVGRAFLEATPAARQAKVRAKHTPIPELMDGMNVIFFDDSIIRADTSRGIISETRAAVETAGGTLKGVYMMIGSPPLRHPCYFGVDMASRDEFVANKVHKDKDEEDIDRMLSGAIAANMPEYDFDRLQAFYQRIARRIGADGLAYLSLDGLNQAVENGHGHFCLACMTGKYPERMVSQEPDKK